VNPVQLAKSQKDDVLIRGHIHRTRQALGHCPYACVPITLFQSEGEHTVQAMNAMPPVIVNNGFGNQALFSEVCISGKWPLKRGLH
jgi:hypothetical protein